MTGFLGVMKLKRSETEYKSKRITLIEGEIEVLGETDTVETMSDGM